MPNSLDVKYHLSIFKVFDNFSPYHCIVWYVISTHVIATKMPNSMIVDKQLYFHAHKINTRHSAVSDIINHKASFITDGVREILK